MAISLFIASKYLISTKEHSIYMMIIMSIISITTVTFAFTLILSIMNGFEIATYQKLQSIHPQIIMQDNASNNILNIEAISKILKSEFKQIKAFSPNQTQYVIATINNNNNNINNLIILKGIDPINEPEINDLENKIKLKLNHNLINLLDNNKVIIGKKISENLGISIGDEIVLLAPEEINNTKISFSKQSKLISAILETGTDEFDSNLILISLEAMQDMFPNSGPTQIGIRLNNNNNNNNEQETIQKLKNRFEMDVYSWKDLYPSLISALKLEKYALAFIILLITLVASMNIVSLLYIFIKQKNKDIAILKSMGFSNEQLKKLFLLIGIGITVISEIIGLFLALILGLILDNYPFIKLPNVYYVDYLPIKMSLNIFLFVFIIILLIGLIATYIPIRSINNRDIIKTLKFN